YSRHRRAGIVHRTASRRWHEWPRFCADPKMNGRIVRTAAARRARRRVETQGQLNAVRATFKARITPSRIARRFGVSQSDVRKMLAPQFRGGWKRQVISRPQT